MRNMDYDPYRDAGCIGERNRCENGGQGVGCGGNCGRPGETAAAEVRWGREVRRDARGQWDQQGRWGQ